MMRTHTIVSAMLLLLSLASGACGALPGRQQETPSVDISFGGGQACLPEFIELTNNEAIPINIDGLTIIQSENDVYRVPNGIDVDPGVTIRIWRTSGMNDARNLYAGRSDDLWRINGLKVENPGASIPWIVNCDPAF